MVLLAVAVALSYSCMGATMLLTPPLLVLDAGATNTEIIFHFISNVVFIIFIWCRELRVRLFMPISSVSNSLPYVPSLFLVMSLTPHNELQVKLFFVWSAPRWGCFLP